MAGRDAEAIRLLTEYPPVVDDSPLIAWQDYFFRLLRFRGFAEAEVFLNQHVATTQADSAFHKRNQAWFHRLWASLESERGDFEAAMRSFRQFLSIDPSMADHAIGLYEDFIMGGRPDLALQLEAGRKRPVLHEKTFDYWRALALRHTGHVEQAERVLRDATARPVPDGDDYELKAWALAHFYAGKNLEQVCETLDELIEEGYDFEDITYYTLGLAAAVTGKLDLAREHLAVSVDTVRMEANGRALNREHWYHCTQLLDQSALDAVREFFDPVNDEFVSGAGI
jgi:tetratricopeptide (TPR) repeat protein